MKMVLLNTKVFNLNLPFKTRFFKCFSFCLLFCLNLVFVKNVLAGPYPEEAAAK